MYGRYVVAMADLVSMFAVGEVSDSLPVPAWNIEHTKQVPVVDADQPPLQLFLGNYPPEVERTDDTRRDAAWEAWNDIPVAAA